MHGELHGELLGRLHGELHGRLHGESHGKLERNLDAYVRREAALAGISTKTTGAGAATPTQCHRERGRFRPAQPEADRPPSPVTMPSRAEPNQVEPNQAQTNQAMPNQAKPDLSVSGGIRELPTGIGLSAHRFSGETPTNGGLHTGRRLLSCSGRPPPDALAIGITGDRAGRVPHPRPRSRPRPQAWAWAWAPGRTSRTTGTGLAGCASESGYTTLSSARDRCPAGAFGWPPCCR